MVKNGLIAMAVMIAAVAVSGGLIMSQQNVKYNNDMTGFKIYYEQNILQKTDAGKKRCRRG